MKAIHAVILNEWITNNRSKLEAGERGTLAECAALASADLKFKVSTNSLRDLMLEQGIETKRPSKSAAEKLRLLSENERLKAQTMELRRTLAKVAASQHVPDDVKEFLFAGLNDEIKAAIGIK